VASHAATDFFNVAKIKTFTLHESSLLTCMTNDFGYENAFARILDQIIIKDDVLIAISSSGNSINIRNAVDIGAHVGISVHQWAPLFEHVHAFEPMIDHFECLELNTSRFDNVTRHNCAMSNQSAMLKGAYRTMKNSGSFQLVDDEFVAVNHKKAKIYDIPSQRLDDFELENVDLIKIDVEGWELDVLRGAKQTIQRCHPVMMIEYNQGGGREHKSMHTYDIREYFELIDELGYEQVGVVNDDYIYRVKS
jgi:FkbM family methyltransferase